jgi:catechol 2,3-dioxygenase-like lactoylglutathione lyase family enzyme/ketosteroid isomerase-like protein
MGSHARSWGFVVLAVSGCTACGSVPGRGRHAPEHAQRCVLSTAVSSDVPPLVVAPRTDRVALEELEDGDGPARDRRAIATVIEELWSAWVLRDREAYAARLAPDATRAIRQTGRIERGAAAIVAALPVEQLGFERDGDELGVSLHLRHVAIEVEGDDAVARYAVRVRGGDHWDFEDRLQVLQLLQRRQGRWLLLHQSEGSDPSTGEAPGSRRELTVADIGFDYAYPVRDLDRAVRFYTELLGPPASVGPTRATFQLGGGRFHLDATELEGLAPVRDAYPNGYPIFETRDLEARVASLRAHGVEMASEVSARDPDRWVAALDEAGNVFVLEERNHAARAALPSRLTFGVTALPPACVGPARAYVERWLAGDVPGLAAAHTRGARYFDDTSRGSAVPRREIEALLREQLSRRDRGHDGLAATFTVSEIDVRPIGRAALVTYTLDVTSTGPHPIRERLLVTQRWSSIPADLSGVAPITDTFVVRSEATPAMAQALDYTGAPAESLEDAEHLYRRVMHFGEPYRDEDYVGFWGLDTVFGVYEADRAIDGVPVRGRANGYMSFWVRDIEEAHAFLVAHHARFPVVPAIVERAGIDTQPGYRQILATDSEGNLLLLTEYTHDDDA